MQPLPTEVQTIEAMAMRYPFAIEDVFSQEKADDPKTAPMLRRRHVFDFEGGLRLIIFRHELNEELGVLLHVSGSVWRADRLPNLNSQFWAATQATWMVGELNKIAQVEPMYKKDHEDLVTSSVQKQGVTHLLFRDLEERRREAGV